MNRASAARPAGHGLSTRGAIVALVLLAGLAARPGAEERTAPALYNAALARERGLRAPAATPTLSDLRATIATYETIVRRFPTSQYGDHALWQAAGLALETFDRYRQAQDFDNGVRLLNTLAREYAVSPFASRVDERRQQLAALTQLVWLRGIERELRDDVVRITVHLDGEVRFHSEHIQDPSRLFFDLRGTETSAPLRNATLTFDDDGDVVREIRLGRHPNHTTRLVLDMKNVEDYHVFTLYDPFRLVVDCRPADTETAGDTPLVAPAVSHPVPAAPAPWPPPEAAVPDAPGFERTVRKHAAQERAAVPAEDRAFEPADTLPPADAPATTEDQTAAATPDGGPLLLPAANSTGTYSLARQLGLGVSRLVIDPGHGGLDPGARAHGLVEADLVLDIAHRLEQRLSAYPNFEVVLARRKDDYMPLEARTALARRVGADLFLSIHANASRLPHVRGVETYFLNLTTDPDVEALAARENVAGIGRMGNLEQLVQAITTNTKLDESRDFAEMVQASMVKKLRGVDPSIPDLGVKQAPFVVLIGADIPSVLAEISFVTNDHDATMLSTAAYRDLIADALFDGVLRYQLSLETTSRTGWQANENDGS